MTNQERLILVPTVNKGAIYLQANRMVQSYLYLVPLSLDAQIRKVGQRCLRKAHALYLSIGFGGTFGQRLPGWPGMRML